MLCLSYIRQTAFQIVSRNKQLVSRNKQQSRTLAPVLAKLCGWFPVQLWASDSLENMFRLIPVMWIGNTKES